MRRTGLLRSACACIGIAIATVLPSSHAQEPDAARQEPAAPQPTFRGGTNFVTVDVFVTDGGRNVTNLTKADFEVTEDGQPQVVEYFRAVDVDAPRPFDQPPAPIRNRNDEEREAAAEDVAVIAIVLDEYHLRSAPPMRVREVLARFIERDLRPQDMIALLFPTTPVTTLQFTRDHAAIADQIREWASREWGRSGLPRDQFEEAQARLSPAQAARIRREVVVGMLEGLAIRLAGLREGRKSILYVGDGFPELVDASVALDLRSFYRVANRGNTSVYAVYPGGLTIGGNRAGMDLLRAMAIETDGRAIVNTNGLSEGLSQMVRDSTFYYLLGYASTGVQTDGKFHKIDVRVKRRGVDVRARKGYWAMDVEAMRAASPPPPEVPRPIQLALQSIAPALNSGRYLQTWTGIDRGDDGRARVTVVWEPLAATPGVRREPVTSVSILAADRTGEILARERRPAGTLAPARQQLTFDAPAGRVELELGVEGGAGAGTLDRDQRTLVVPDFTATRVALTTPRVFRARTAREFEAVLADPSLVPVAGRQFSRGERLLIRFGVYGSAGESSTPTAILLNRAGQKMTDLTTVTGAAGAHHIDVSLNALPPGEYLVEIGVRNGDAETKEYVPFKVGG